MQSEAETPNWNYLNLKVSANKTRKMAFLKTLRFLKKLIAQISWLFYVRKPRRGFSISQKRDEIKHLRQAEKGLPNANYYTENVVHVVPTQTAIAVDEGRVRVRARILSTKPPALMVAAAVIRPTHTRFTKRI